MVEHEEITGTMRGDSDNDLVSEFIGKLVKWFRQKLRVTLMLYSPF